MPRSKTRSFMFVQEGGGHFKVVVLARNLRLARKYVKNQAISVIAYRTLKYIGEGSPSINQRTGFAEGWCAVPRHMTEEA